MRCHVLMQGTVASQASSGMHRLLGSSICVLMLLLQLHAPMLRACHNSCSPAQCAVLLLILVQKVSGHAFHSSCGAFHKVFQHFAVHVSQT